jgi:hypothetical protein
VAWARSTHAATVPPARSSCNEQRSTGLVESNGTRTSRRSPSVVLKTNCRIGAAPPVESILAQNGDGCW